ncbi:MAG: hypothetical protein ACYTXY_16375 [Nostoc sp.]
MLENGKKFRKLTERSHTGDFAGDAFGGLRLRFFISRKGAKEEKRAIARWSFTGDRLLICNNKKI